MLSNGRPNGGDVVVFRTLWVDLILLVVMGAIKATDWPYISACEFLSQTLDEVIGMLRDTQGPVVFGAVYVALYARFTSQWTYMANLYNLIKQAEVTQSGPTPPPPPTPVPPVPPVLQALSAQALAIAQWKAGYIEDAYTTHMATKPMVAGVIKAWYGLAEVRAAFEDGTPRHHEIVAWLHKHGVLH